MHGLPATGPVLCGSIGCLHKNKAIKWDADTNRDQNLGVIIVNLVSDWAEGVVSQTGNAGTFIFMFLIGCPTLLL